MSEQLKEDIENLISYYGYHGIENLIETHPGFVVEDFGKLLIELEKEIA